MTGAAGPRLAGKRDIELGHVGHPLLIGPLGQELASQDVGNTSLLPSVGTVFLRTDQRLQSQSLH